MKYSKKAWLSMMAASAVTFGVISTAQAQSYQGTAYVAGMGGHFAVADITISPDESRPITVNSLDKIDIGTGSSHPVHDARIDVQDNNTMYWSTYKPDADADGMLHYGKSDLSSGDVLQDVPVKVPEGTLNNKANYCASGQSKDYFFPVSMAKPGYISVIRKSDMKLMHQVFLEGTDADIKSGYKYFHGINSPDMKEMLITINESDVPADSKELGNTVGKLHLIVLDIPSLEQGKVKVLRKNVVPGNAKTTISFRQYYSPDGKYIANATGDILFLIDAKTLEVMDAETAGPLEQFHDSIFTADSKYVVATSRSKNVFPDCQDPTKPGPDEFLMDGHLKLYDVEAKKFVGKSSSVCLSCHDEMLGRGDDAVHAVLCGLDVNWK